MGTIGGYRPELIRRRGIAAALLNASGLGAGYLHLRLWARATACWLVTAALIATANALNAAGTPLPWLAVYLLWLAAMAADGYRRVRHLPLPDPAAPPGRPWLPYAAAGTLLVVVAAGLTFFRSIPTGEFDRAERAHADRDCAGALPHYERAAAGRYAFALNPASAEARTGRDACAVALRAEAAAGDGDFEEAVAAYESYLGHYDGAPPWEGAEARLGQVRMAAADALAEAATGADGDDGGEGADGADLSAAYRAAVEAYTTVRAEHPDAPEAARVPGRIAALYEAGTADLTDRPCATVGDLEAFEDLSTVETSEAAQLAARARDGLPGAQLACGEERFAAEEFCRAGDAFEAASRLPGATAGQREEAEESTGRSLYECGVAHYEEREWARARDALQRLIDGYPDDARAPVADELLIAVEISEIGEGTTGALPPPRPAGGAPGSTVTVELVNDSTEALEILWTGPETGTASIDACTDCTTRDGLDGRLGEACGTDRERPARTLTLAPGAYELVVRTTTGAYVTPYAGDWTLTGGTAYTDCYYISATQE
ncbi:tetratricopeptide repeat protein [Streptomyces sp. SBT349]|uniref:tetratricopeptide repeat protein n=1 Tax=Streptomyces sp. SBT349 TaxID=1580539 RepID=UPI00066E0C8B|nr:tetratricopeptide repeat protein [Streptomyces sp. SBT349]